MKNRHLFTLLAFFLLTETSWAQKVGKHSYEEALEVVAEELGFDPNPVPIPEFPCKVVRFSKSKKKITKILKVGNHDLCRRGRDDSGRGLFITKDTVQIPVYVKEIPNGAGEDFFNPEVSEQELLDKLEARSIPALKFLLKNLKRTNPSTVFTETGKMADFNYRVPEYQVDHAINYYIPKSYKPGTKAPVLVILHGGGGSTNTYESSRSVSQMYLESFISFSEKNAVILVAPASRLGWTFNLRILVSQMIALVKKELDVDSNRVVLWGHSMGAMGITRESHWLPDEVSSVLADAGGMQDEFRITPIFKTYFDRRFIHSQGLKDHFQDFVTRTRDVLLKVGLLELEKGVKSLYEAHFQEERTHSYDLDWTFEKLEKDLFKSPRNLYKRNLHPLLARLDTKNNPYGPDVSEYVLNKYFWLEAPELLKNLPRKEFSQGKDENFISLEAKVADNTYEISTFGHQLSVVRVLVSSKLVDLSRPVRIKVDGTLLFEGMVKKDPLRILEIARDRQDPDFIFDNFVDVRL